MGVPAIMDCRLRKSAANSGISNSCLSTSPMLPEASTLLREGERSGVKHVSLVGVRESLSLDSQRELVLG